MGINTGVSIARTAEDSLVIRFGNESLKISVVWFLGLFWDEMCLLSPLFVSFILLLEFSSVYSECQC